MTTSERLNEFQRRALSALRKHDHGASPYILHEDDLPDLTKGQILLALEILTEKGEVRRQSSWTGPWFYAQP